MIILIKVSNSVDVVLCLSCRHRDREERDQSILEAVPRRLPAVAMATSRHQGNASSATLCLFFLPLAASLKNTLKRNQRRVFSFTSDLQFCAFSHLPLPPLLVCLLHQSAKRHKMPAPGRRGSRGILIYFFSSLSITAEKKKKKKFASSSPAEGVERFPPPSIVTSSFDVVSY